MNQERYKQACAVIRCAISHIETERVLSIAGHTAQAISDAYSIGQAEDIQCASPVPMLLWCPECNERHVDEGAFEHEVHHTHACQHCGHVWRPAVVTTCGVRFLPGFGGKS